MRSSGSRRCCSTRKSGAPGLVHEVVEPGGNDETDPTVSGGHHAAHCEADDGALVVGDVVEMRRRRVKVDLDGAQARPVERQRPIDVRKVRGNPDAGDPAARRMSLIRWSDRPGSPSQK